MDTSDIEGDLTEVLFTEEEIHAKIAELSRRIELDYAGRKPLLIGVLSGSALFGFAVSAVLFAGAHRYQGWKGMAGSAALSVIFTVFYWMTASLWMTMVLHMLVDLNGLVLRPLVLGLRASGDSRS